MNYSAIPTRSGDLASQFRLYIANPFPDMYAIREQLLGSIIPELSLLCRTRGGDLVTFDLHQSVPGEEGEEAEMGRLLEEMSGRRSFLLAFIGSRYDWIPAPHEITSTDLLRRYPWLRQAAAVRSSLTELEILERVLDDPLMAGRAIFYMNPAGGRESGERGGDRLRFENLNRKIRSSGFPLREGSPDMAMLAERIREDLLEVIDRIFPLRSALSPLEAERRAQEAFARTRRRAYVEVPGYLRRLDEHVEGEAPPLVVTGSPGAGKSALLAYWSDRYHREHPDAFIITHYIGATSSGGDHYALLRRIMAEIKARYDLEEAIPISAEEIDSALPFWLGYIQREKLVLVIDALNQLDEESLALDWLPEYIQPRVRLVVSAVDGPLQTTLRERGWRELHVEPLTLDERKEVVRRYLGDFSGKFSSEQLRRVSGDSTSANPLFLRTRLEELRMFESSDRLNERIDHYLAARDLDDLFQRVLQRLEDEHGEAIVRDVMTLVWASRRGLSDAELAGITGADREALGALIGALEYHLMRREGLLAFFHDHLRQAVANRYLAGGGSAVDELHLGIARYFAGEAVGPRRAEEEPWQLQQAHAWKDLEECLSSIEMFGALCGESTTYQLMGYWLAIGDRYDMVEAYRRSLARYEATHDGSDLPTLLDDLGRFYSESGRYEEGELLCRRSLEMRERISGENALETVNALDNLSTLLYHTGRSEEAIALSRRALEIRERVLGEEHPDIARNLSSLGALLYAAKDYEEAERLLQRALSLGERVASVSVQVVATILNNLGAILIATERYDAALPYFERARQINERIYGAEHPEIASNLVNIAVILENQGDLEASEKIYRQALAISERVLGPDHPHLAVTLTNLGGVVRDTGDLEGAETIFRRALGIRERVLGSDNVETVATMLRLGYVLRRKKDFVGAHELYGQALLLRERICGPDDPYLERIRKGLAEVEELMKEATQREAKEKKKQMRPADVRRAGRK